MLLDIINYNIEQNWHEYNHFNIMSIWNYIKFKIHKIYEYVEKCKHWICFLLVGKPNLLSSFIHFVSISHVSKLFLSLACVRCRISKIIFLKDHVAYALKEFRTLSTSEIVGQFSLGKGYRSYNWLNENQLDIYRYDIKYFYNYITSWYAIQS